MLNSTSQIPGHVSADNRSQEMKSKVVSWLIDEGWRISEGSSPDAKWVISAEDSAERRVVVGQKTNRPDQIVILAAVGVDKGQQRQLAGLKPEDRREFLWDIRFRLLAAGVDFSGIRDPLERVEVLQRIYYDGLTKDAFLQRFSLVTKGLLTVLWMIGRKFVQPAPPGEPSIGFRPSPREARHD